jgi:sugar/nucleoside kinase (ribokinase family)
VVTLGAEGAIVVDGDEPVVRMPAAHVDRVVDTTGAGDLFAAGYLYGLVHGFNSRRCARLGAIAAAEVISHLGARPEADLRDAVAGAL